VFFVNFADVASLLADEFEQFLVFIVAELGEFIFIFGVELHAGICLGFFFEFLGFFVFEVNVVVTFRVHVFEYKLYLKTEAET
jgi:hypothetical protein